MAGNPVGAAGNRLFDSHGGGREEVSVWKLVIGDWLSMKPLIAVLAPLCVCMLLVSIHELEDHLRPDQPATWTRAAFVCMIIPTLVLVWWGIR
ncbi:hypothetical protein [Luteolibacter luteus]|uniref:Uncharacterized protein n=1 Tax=Luteolibacter luteus TaxID=2728835 RepID=A0A858RIY6_9BACT|nr:hypothetical protein [Luteolibacter luteus]QJE96494.1 hypothetical protein HHL09_12100 [Luteolibacter luteus]